MGSSSRNAGGPFSAISSLSSEHRTTAPKRRGVIAIASPSRRPRRSSGTARCWCRQRAPPGPPSQRDTSPPAPREEDCGRRRLSRKPPLSRLFETAPSPCRCYQSHHVMERLARPQGWHVQDVKWILFAARLATETPVSCTISEASMWLTAAVVVAAVLPFSKSTSAT
jgi:hypothetical protein